MLYKYMKKKICITIGIIELCIGITTLISCFLVQFGILPEISQKPSNVLAFVIITSIISICLGFGMLRIKDLAKKLLIFFSGYIILTKVLIYTGIIVFTGHYITFVSQGILDLISTLYHSLIIILLIRK